MPASRLTAIVTALGAFAGANAYAAGPAYQPQVTEEPILFETYGGETVDAFRGTMNVPVNRDDPGSAMIDLAYVRFPATGDVHTPIIYLAGGPGGSGIATARWRRFPMFMAMREYGDVIAFDQRGTGDSDDRAPCRSSVTIGFEERVSDEDIANRYREAALECAGRWKEQGLDIQGFTTMDSVQDIHDLRLALGADKVSLWGISYGSHLALAALKGMEGEIDRVVLASVEGLNQTVKLPSETDAYFARLQQAVNSDPQAAALYPDIAGLIMRVHAKLEEQPLALTVNAPWGEQPFLFQRSHMQQIASAFISDPDNAAQLLGLYLAVDAGMTAPVAGLIGSFLDEDEKDAISLSPMSTAMDIASGITAERLAIVEEQAKTSLLRDYLNFPMPQLNGMLGLDLGDGFRIDPVTDVPVLVFSGTLDGRTYPDSQKEAVSGLSDVTIIEVTNAGHNLFMSSPEVMDRIDAFMSGETVPAEPILVPLLSFLPEQPD